MHRRRRTAGSPPLSYPCPFQPQAYLQNLKPKVAEANVLSFFQELEEGVVALDLGAAKGKGEGKVEFKDRETLVRWV